MKIVDIHFVSNVIPAGMYLDLRLIKDIYDCRGKLEHSLEHLGVRSISTVLCPDWGSKRNKKASQIH